MTQSTLRLLHLFECACELWHLPAFVSVMCEDVFSVLHGTQICLTFQFKNPNYVHEREISGWTEKNGLFCEGTCGYDKPFFFFFFFEEAAFFFLFHQLELARLQ